MEEFRIEAPVSCADGKAGKVYAVVIDPVRQEMTHLVVKEPGRRDMERLVPITSVATATHEAVQLACTLAEFKEFESFLQKRYIEALPPNYVSMQTGQYIVPYTTDLSAKGRHVTEETVPPGELAVHRGAIVDALDGHIGHVGEFVVDETTGRITHIVLEKGHLWTKREIAVPIDHVGTIEGDKVHLYLDKAAIAALPSLDLNRNY